MKSRKCNKSKNGHIRSIIQIALSISAGLVMLIAPEITSDLIIRGVGLVWILEGIYCSVSLQKD